MTATPTDPMVTEKGVRSNSANANMAFRSVRVLGMREKRGIQQQSLPNKSKYRRSGQNALTCVGLCKKTMRSPCDMTRP